MEHSKHLLTPTQCILRVLWPLPRPSTRQVQRILLGPQIHSNTHKRTYAYFLNPKSYPSNNGNGGARKPPPSKDPLGHLVKDEAIQSHIIRTVQEDGKLGPEQTLKSALFTLDRDTDILVQVDPPSPSNPVPICKIQKRADLIRRKVEQQKTVRQQQRQQKDRLPKQIELNWAIDAHDLEIKLGQLAQFIGKGKTVEIILAARKKSRKATESEGQAVLNAIKDKLVEIDAKEMKPMEGQILRQAMLTVRKKTLD